MSLKPDNGSEQEAKARDIDTARKGIKSIVLLDHVSQLQ